MSRVINKSSPKMSETNNSVSKYNFPWDEIEIGYSFGVEDSEISLSYLRSMATQKGSQLKKKFKVIDHGVTQTPRYEVGRLIAPTEEEIKAQKEDKLKRQQEYNERIKSNPQSGFPPWEVKPITDTVGTVEAPKVSFFGDDTK